MKIGLFSRRTQQQNETFEELIAPQMPALYRLAYHYTGSQPDAEDLVQDVLIKLYPKYQELQKVESLRPWLAKVLYRAYIDRMRHASRQAVDLAKEYDDLEGVGAKPGDNHEKRVDTIRDLEAALTYLPEEQRMVVLMHDVESYTQEEIGGVLGVPLGTVKSRLHRGRAKLRELLS